MAETTLQDATILVADVTASVELYERLGDAEAFARIADGLDRLRRAVEAEGGRFVQSRGDDALFLFAEAERAARAALAALAAAAAHDRAAGVQLHVAVHRGEVIVARDSIFGDAVNVTYRLASIANAGEALASGPVAERLSPRAQAALRQLRAFRFKGREAPVDVYGLETPSAAPVTQLPAHFAAAHAAPAPTLLRLEHGGRYWDIREAESLALGRAEGSDLMIPLAWVSRRHATLHVRDGVAMLTDRSTYGSYISPSGGGELHIRRQSVPLSGAGVITPGASPATPDADAISYAVMALDREPPTAV